MNKKGLFFTIDAIIGLLFVGVCLLILTNSILENTNEVEKIIINNKISDLLITAQLLEIENIKNLEKNYKLLLNNKKGYIILNNKKIEINQNNFKNKLISQNIKYINSSNKIIYIEIGVYH